MSRVEGETIYVLHDNVSGVDPEKEDDRPILYRNNLDGKPCMQFVAGKVTPAQNETASDNISEVPTIQKSDRSILTYLRELISNLFGSLMN